MRDIYLYQLYHLGDSIYNINLYRQWVKDYDDIRVLYYIQPEYIEILKPFIRGYESKILLIDINNKPATAIDTWVGHSGYDYKISIGIPLDVIYYEYYHWFSFNLGLKCNFIDNIDSLVNYYEYLEEVNLFGNHIDLLLTNSTPLSNQWWVNNEFEHIINNIDLDRYNVVSLQPTGNPKIPCTMDYNLNLFQLGNLALKTDYILGVHSGPWCTLINKWSITRVKKWSTFQRNGIHYSWNCNNFRDSNDVINNIKLI